ALWRSDRATTRPVTAATLATDGDGAVSVLAAAEDVGIIATRLTDGASESVREGLPLVRVTALATLGDALYVATAGQGVFRRPHPAARAFEPFNNGLLFLAP
ncbi:hypothetical protein K8I61_09800, partial [bacterium]|nr:hypothetical protein [bacterium]